jgi:cobalt/nickel transport system ATP-binding protein
VDLLPLFADRIVVLDRGRVLQDGTADDIFRQQEMIDRAGLRIPYISRLLYEMKRYDGVPIEGLPLTIGEARKQLLSLLSPEAAIGAPMDAPSEKMEAG